MARQLVVVAGAVELPGALSVPAGATGIVVFAHGSGSSRFSSRNRYVAAELDRDRLATLLIDLLTPEEEGDRARVFDVQLLASRLEAATRRLAREPDTAELQVGYFGASTGAAAALWAAADNPSVAAVVSRGGRPDLAEPRLDEVRAPTLLVVGGHDEMVLQLNRAALALLSCPAELRIVPGATHLFEEPGALSLVAAHARDWFGRYLAHAPAAHGHRA